MAKEVTLVNENLEAARTLIEHYRDDGQGDPFNRRDNVHALATGMDGSVTSIGDGGLAELYISMSVALKDSGDLTLTADESKTEIATLAAACQHYLNVVDPDLDLNKAMVTDLRDELVVVLLKAD